MKIVFFIMTMVIGTMMAVPSNAQTPTSGAASVVLFYADWCGSCKILQPKLKQAMSNVKSSKINLVVLDMTDEESKAKASDLADKKVLSNIYQSYAPKTGMAILVDGKGKEVGKLKKNQSVADMESALKSLDGGQS